MANNFANGYAPRGWLDDPTSQAYLAAHGAACLEGFAVWRDTVKVRYASTAPEDALVWIGEARQLERGPTEATADYRLRLARCFEIHEDRTTKDAYRHALEPLGVDPADVYVWNHYEAGVGIHWSTVWIVVDSTAGPWTASPECDDGLTLDAGLVFDISGLTTNMLTYLRRFIRRHKWTGAYPVAIWVVLSGQCFDMGLSADGGLVCDDGTNDTAIIPLGRVWDQETLFWDAAPLKCDGGATLDNAFFD